MKNLMEKKQWVGRAANKKPINPFTGYGADCNDRSTWGTANEAWAGIDTFGYEGVGVEFADNLAGIDIDAHGVDANPLADEILDMFAGTYMERSVSGFGWHILFYVDYGVLADNGIINDELEFTGYQNHNKKLDLETYITGRYFTVSGHVDATGRHESHDLVDMTDTYIAFLKKYMLDEKPTYQAPTQQPHVELDMTTEQILAKARTHANGAKFIALYDNGDWQGYYKSQSEADLGLCDTLVWYLGKDAARVDAAFRDSALMRDKWYEKHGKQTYGEMTIAAAIRDVQGQYDPFGAEEGVNMRTSGENPSESLSEPQRGYRNRELFDLKAFQDYLKSKGIRIVLNDITQVPSVRGFGEKQYGKQNAIKALPANIEGELKRMYTNVSLNGIREYIEVEAMDRENHFNPVLEYFEGKEYDGKDHLAEVFRALRIEDDRLSQVLIYKWFLQGWALLYNDPDEPYAADGVLTLAGPQGCGKTTFFEKCAILPEFFRSGQSISTHDKDPERRAITTWISELGEVGCTFKSGLDELKKFITQERDEYRLSYARYDVVAPRRTNLGATVNGDQYLIDETGNRRFWTVPLTKDVDHHALRYDIDWTQVWLEVRAKSKFDTFIDDRDKRSACYRLTPEQRAALDARNVDCEKSLEYEDEVREVLTNCEKFGAQKRKTSVKAWIDHNTVLSETCHNDTRKSQKVGKVLDKLGYPVEGKDGKHGRWRMLPWI